MIHRSSTDLRRVHPPVPCKITTTGTGPAVRCGRRSSPVIVLGRPFLSHVRNCWSVNVRDWKEPSSIRWARSLCDYSASTSETLSRVRPTVATLARLCIDVDPRKRRDWLYCSLRRQVSWCDCPDQGQRIAVLNAKVGTFVPDGLKSAPWTRPWSMRQCSHCIRFLRYFCRAGPPGTDAWGPRAAVCSATSSAAVVRAPSTPRSARWLA